MKVIDSYTKSNTAAPCTKPRRFSATPRRAAKNQRRAAFSSHPPKPCQTAPPWAFCGLIRAAKPQTRTACPAFYGLPNVRTVAKCARGKESANVPKCHQFTKPRGLCLCRQFVAWIDSDTPRHPQTLPSLQSLKPCKPCQTRPRRANCARFVCGRLLT